METLPLPLPGDRARQLALTLALTSAWLLAVCLFSATLGASLTQAQTTVLAPQTPNDFQEATLLYRAGQYDTAMARVNAWLKTRPKDARGRFLRGMIFGQQQKLDDAARTYTELTQDYPELPEPYNNLAVIFAHQGDFEKAHALLESALRANAAFTAAHENLGDVHARLAAMSYEKALKLDTANKAASAKLKAINDMLPSRTSAPGATPAKIQ